MRHLFYYDLNFDYLFFSRFFFETGELCAGVAAHCQTVRIVREP